MASTPDVTTTFWVGMIFMALLSLYFYLTHRAETDAPERWQVWRAAYQNHRSIVKDNRITAPADPVIMSRAEAQTAQTGQTDTQTDELSVEDRWLDRLEVDRTKTALIELLVYSGWDVSQIRSVVKGDNGTLGTEVEAARQRLGMPANAPYKTPVAERPADPRLFASSPESSALN